MSTSAIGSKQEQLLKSGSALSGLAQTNSLRLVQALYDLYQLLEEYAPSWYTDEHRQKAEAALYSSHRL
jgi:hypothetical protein